MSRYFFKEITVQISCISIPIPECDRRSGLDACCANFRETIDNDGGNEVTQRDWAWITVVPVPAPLSAFRNEIFRLPF